MVVKSLFVELVLQKFFDITFLKLSQFGEKIGELLLHLIIWRLDVAVNTVLPEWNIYSISA